MNLSALSIFALLAASSQLLSVLSLPTVGATYFLTNEPTGNYIVSADIGRDGKLTVANAVFAGGNGAHGLPNGPTDPFFSQGAIRTSAAGNFLATVNAGSDTVVIFAIDPQTPSKITMIGSPVSSQGQFPMSVAINKSATQVCVLNGGKINGVKCFSVNKKLGLIPQPEALRPLNINQTTPATGPNGAASDLIFSEDGTKLIASVKFSPPAHPQGFLATWDLASNGSPSATFTKSAPGPGGLSPFGMAPILGTNALLVADVQVGFGVYTFQGSTATSTIVPITDQGATCWTTFSPKTGTFFLSDPALPGVTEVRVDKNLQGSIVNQYILRNGTSPSDSTLISVGNQDFLFVLSSRTLTIEVFSPVSPGNLVHLQSFDVSIAAKRAGVAVNFQNTQGLAAFRGL